MINVLDGSRAGPDMNARDSPGGAACVLAINAGSSSIRFALYGLAGPLQPRIRGKIERIGLPRANLTTQGRAGTRMQSRAIQVRNHADAAHALIAWLDEAGLIASIHAVGHRVVHGMKHHEPARITPKLLAELRRITPYAPDHLPHEIGLMEAIRRKLPGLAQVACFDTAFHRTMPQVARLLPIPRRYAVKGVERYGFHGLSYAYLTEELGRLDPAAARGRVILAHLGNGASLAAVHRGKSVDTSMGFTPTAGLVMSTRTGDLDPGLAYYLARTGRMTPAQFHHMINHESGLLGVSGTSPDIKDLLARESRDPRAAQAVALFCYQAKKWIGSFAAALGGLDTLVFSGGIGENAPLIRKRICDGLGFLGVELNRRRNSKNASLISRDAGRVAVRVIRTDEELMIARSVIRILPPGAPRKRKP